MANCVLFLDVQINNRMYKPKFIQNINMHLPVYMVSQPRRQQHDKIQYQKIMHSFKQRNQEVMLVILWIHLHVRVIPITKFL
jgi:hypothetical protein